ncbi:MAG: TIGR00268 family protein, partial [Lachnospiraceae bacterium]|nr:TIGR00268 family protein [Lachnospiraceae bacterium]
FQYYRLRLHGELVRIEVMPEELERLATKNVRERLVTELKALGFLYVTMDLQGYRRGSLNEVL